MEEKKLNNRKTFFSLPKSAREWLGSETATQIIIDLNKKHHIYREKIKVIPRLITQLIVGMINCDNFSEELSKHLPLLSPKEINHITDQIKSRILKPIAGTLRSPFGIDIYQIKSLPDASPQARVMDLESPRKKIPKPPKGIGDLTSKPKLSPNPKARVTEFVHSNTPHIRKTSKNQGSAPKKDIGAEISDPKKPLTLVEKNLE